MSKLFATAGARFYIGSAPKAFSGTDFTIADFPSTGGGAITWTEIKGITNLGTAGDTSALVSSNVINEGRTRKLKGTRNAGSMQVVANLDYADPGQLAVIAAEKAKETYPFRVVFNDAPTGGTPSERLFVALVMSAAEQWNEADSVMALNATLELDSNIVRVAAA